MAGKQTKAAAAASAFMKYGGLRAIGNILASRKGVFGLLAMGLSYYLLVGRLPEDAPEDLMVKMCEVFGTLVGVIAGLFIGGTALEDALKKGAKNAGPEWVVPMAEVVGETYTDYIHDGKVDLQAIIQKGVEDELARRKDASAMSVTGVTTGRIQSSEPNQPLP